jgi:hypothetical protein
MTRKNLHLLPSSFVQPSFGLWARACLSTQLSRGSSSSCDQKKKTAAVSTQHSALSIQSLASFQCRATPVIRRLAVKKDFIFNQKPNASSTVSQMWALTQLFW